MVPGNDALTMPGKEFAGVLINASGAKDLIPVIKRSLSAAIFSDGNSVSAAAKAQIAAVFKVPLRISRS